MKAMLLSSYGEDAKFELVDIEKPQVKPGHVLIKIAASSVNTVDTMIRKMGKELPLSPDTPAILGMDFAGTVEASGEGVSTYAAGDEVYGCAGGLADLPGQKVLVHGGSGGVGHVALQLATHFGADVYSTGGGDKQLALIEQLGATGINYKTESVEQYVAKHTAGKGFDLVFDSVGGANMLNSFEAAALNGQVASTVSLCELDLTLAHFKGLSLHVVFMLIPMLHNFKREQHAEILRSLAQIIESGGLKPVLDEKRYGLEQAGQAHARLESRQAMGKIVIEN